MNCELLRVLEEVNSESGRDNYHIYSNYGPSKEWRIDSSNLSKFWKAYCRLVEEDFYGDYALSEIPQKIMPIILDFTFKFDPEKCEEDYFDNNAVFCLIQICQKAIHSVFETSMDVRELICCYLESDDYWEEEILTRQDSKILECTRLRLHFPFCKIDVAKNYKILISEVLKLLSESKIYKLFRSPPEEKWDTILAQDTMLKPVLMYGSSEAADAHKLEIKNIFDYITDEYFDMSGVRLEVSDEMPALEYEEVFDFRQHGHCQNNWINRNLFREHMDPVFWLPLYLSTHYFSGNVTNKKMSSKVQKDKGKGKMSDIFLITPDHTPHSPGEDEYQELENEEFVICQDLLPLLKPFRFEEKNFWEEIAQALHNSTNGDKKGLILLEEYTERYCSHRMKEARNYYRAISNSYITHRTIGWYAREDNRRGYNQWHKNWYLEAMEEALSALDNDVAKALYRFYWLDFLCTNHGKAQYVRWWEFMNHTWRESCSDHPLRVKISNQFTKSFEALQSTISRRIVTETNEDKRVRDQLNLKKIGNLLKKLKTYSAKTTFMKEVAEFFFFRDFDKIKDENDNLTGVKNGVIEVCGDRCIFRSGKPEDYVTKATICPYDPGLSFDDDLVVETLEWIHQVFPNEELARHFLKYCASFLKSGNRDKLFVVFVGAGDNSKSMICKLFGLFGDYCVEMPLSCVTGGRRGGPTPELARTRAAKLAIMQEPENDDVIKEGVLKRMTGGDKFYTRFLNENGGEIRNTFKLILQTNKIPVFKDADGAVKKRFRVFPFLSKWVDEAPASPEERYKTRTFQKDPFFEERVKLMQPAFLWLCKEYFPIYMKEGLDDPEIVKNYTAKYWRDNDVYVQYMMARITAAVDSRGKPDPKATLSISKIYNDFKLFMAENYPNNVVPDIKMLKDKLTDEDKLGKIYGNSWGGIRFKEYVADLSNIKAYEGNSAYAGEGSMGLNGLPMIGVAEGSSKGDGTGLLGL